MNTFAAILTDTTNRHLRDRLPLAGEITVHEWRTDGTPQPLAVTFRERHADQLAAPVHVDHATYDMHPAAAARLGIARAAAEIERTR